MLIRNVRIFDNDESLVDKENTLGSSEDEVLDRSYSNKRYSSMSIEKKIDNIWSFQ